MKRSHFVTALAASGAGLSFLPGVGAGAIPPATAKFKFDFSGFHIYNFRSPNSDTDYASLSVRVGTELYGPVTKFVGDLGKKGDYGVGLSIVAEIPNTYTQVVVSWAVINDDNGRNQGLELTGAVGQKMVGQALNFVPAVGPVLALIFDPLPSLIRNHNGPVVAQTWSGSGVELHSLRAGGGGIGPLNSYAKDHGAKNYGRDLPGSEGSDYDSLAYISRLT